MCLPSSDLQLKFKHISGNDIDCLCSTVSVPQSISKWNDLNVIILPQTQLVPWLPRRCCYICPEIFKASSSTSAQLLKSEGTFCLTSLLFLSACSIVTSRLLYVFSAARFCKYKKYPHTLYSNHSGNARLISWMNNNNNKLLK